jgi:uncharacterized protein (DUF1015 family)
MATVSPFKAWHPSPEKVQRVSSVPYDVLDTQEAREIAEGNEECFLHVTHPEIDLPESTSTYDDSVYKKGAENLQAFKRSSLLKQDELPSLYIYQLEWNGHSQTGIFGCVSVDEYREDIILKHELTRPAKEKDRTRHILAQQAHAEPVILTYKDHSKVNDLITKESQARQPYFDFTADDGVQHKLWEVENTDLLVQACSLLNNLYIADGHHRCKSALNAAGKMREQTTDYSGKEAFNYFPAVIFPMSEMNILAYNRIIHHIPADFQEQLAQNFNLRPNADPTPAHKGEVCLYLNKQWISFTLPAEPQDPSAVEKLDVYRLQKYLLEPLLDIKDPRRDENISFVGGIHGTQKLKEWVDSGKAQLAVSMYPTSIQELVEVSDEKGLMPPKSTWFEPKLRSGLLVHTF